MVKDNWNKWQTTSQTVQLTVSPKARWVSRLPSQKKKKQKKMNKDGGQ